MKPALVSLLVGVLAFLIVAPAPAQEPAFRPFAPPTISHVYTHVTIGIDDTHRVATVEIDEMFRNESSILLEGEYLFPIPRAAVFAGLSLYLDGEELAGEMLLAEQARGVYEEIVRKRKDPALVELIGNGLLRARIFPMEPGAERRVTLRYTHVLERDGDTLRLTTPRLAGMTPIDGSPTIRPVHRGNPEHGSSVEGDPAGRNGEEGNLTVRVTVDGASDLGTPYSPTHTLRIRERKGDRLEITTGGNRADAGDFDLLLPLRRGLLGATLLTHAPRGGREPGYFMLLLSPPTTAGDGDVRIPRDVTLVLDTSGSMRGDKLEQAKAAIGGLLSGLAESDRFRVVTFASVVDALHERLVPATSRNLRRARRDLDGIVADGSTNIIGALEDALSPDAADGRLSLVLFLTDGLPTVGEQDPVRIAEAAGALADGERVFAVGVGHDVNTYLLDRLADSGRGGVTYVRPDEDVERAVSSIARRIAVPALSDLRITGAPVRMDEVHPDPLPDLFFGEELVILGRYRLRASDQNQTESHVASGAVTLGGSVADSDVDLSFDVEFPVRERENAFVARLWAARKAGALTAHIRRHGADAESVAELRELGLRYGVLTDYTAYLVLEPGAVPASADELMVRAMKEAKAPVAQTGRLEFDRASRANALRSAGGIREAEEAMDSLLRDNNALRQYRPDVAGGPASVGEPFPGETRAVEGRIFRREAGVWTDLRHLDADAHDGQEVVTVAAYSPAYFELLQRLPELAPLVSVGDRVMIAGDGITVKIVEDPDDAEAVSEWKDGLLERVVLAFDGGPKPDPAPRP